MLSARKAIVSFFTNDPEVIDLCLIVYPGLLVSVIVNTIMAVFQGGIRALGMQASAALIGILSWTASMGLASALILGGKSHIGIRGL